MSANDDAPWELFSSVDYLAHNYMTVRDDDEQILALLKEYLLLHTPPEGSRVLDIGPGTNLYPSLAVLPWASSIDMVEWAPGNVSWLQSEVAQLGSNWEEFWSRLSDIAPWAALDFRERLRDVAAVRRGSIFDLDTSAWDIGLMFFVAESISDEPAEFEMALLRFAEAIRPGGILLSAFMENSEGYPVGDQHFPAVPVRDEHLLRVLEPICSSLEIHRIDIGEEALREGYSGMLVALAQR